MRAEGGQETGAQVAVELDRIEPAAADNERVGQCALTGANFYEVVSGGRRNGSRYRFDDGFIAEKVLTEAFAGGVRHESDEEALRYPKRSGRPVEEVINQRAILKPGFSLGSLG